MVSYLLHNVNWTWLNIRNSLNFFSNMVLEHSGLEKVSHNLVHKSNNFLVMQCTKLLHISLVFDATGKFPDGILAGNFNALGSYTSCLDVDGQYLQGGQRVGVK